MYYLTANNKNKQRMIGFVAILLCCLLPGQAIASSADQEEWYELNPHDERTLAIALHKSKILKFKKKISQIAIGNADIADAVLLNPKQLYLLGQELGTTNIQVLGEQDQLLTTINMEVRHDLDTLQQNLQELLPNENIQVHSSQKSIVLSGDISTPEQAQTATSLAQTFLPEPDKKTSGDNATTDTGENTDNDATHAGDATDSADSTEITIKSAAKAKPATTNQSVINMLKVADAQQIMLEVKVAEVSQQFLKRLNGNLNLALLDGRFRIGAISGGSTLTSPNGTTNPFSADQSFIGNLFAPDKALFGNYVNKNLLFGAILDAAKQNGQAKVLSEPTLTTTSGQEAKFVSGGEFPTPVPQADGNVAVEFKEFGVQVKFLPIITANNHISLKLDLAVSELSSANSMTLAPNDTNSQLFVPSLTKRSVQTTVELPHGQTLSIAGLISDNTRSSVDKFPGLGDLPVIGAVFRSQEFIQGQTELVVFVTPYFTQPGSTADVTLPTDALTPPNDGEFFLHGQMQGQVPLELAPVPIPVGPVRPAPTSNWAFDQAG